MSEKLSFDASGVQFAFDSTSLGLAFACPRKYQYKMLEDWTASDKSPHLFFGGVYATALEHYHKLRADGATFEEAQLSVTHEALCATWINGEPWESTDNLKTRENLIRSIVWYLEEFKNDNFQTVILTDGRAAVEYSFRLPIFEDIFYCGHLDRLTTDGSDNYIQDQKTTKTTVGPYYFKNYSPDVQMSGYSLAGKVCLQTPIKGVMIDAAQIAVGFTRFVRGFAFRSDENLSEWLDQVKHKIKEVQLLTKMYRESEDFDLPMNYASCGNYGGCEFRDICGLPRSLRKNFLKANFKKNVWDPLKER